MCVIYFGANVYGLIYLALSLFFEEVGFGVLEFGNGARGKISIFDDDLVLTFLFGLTVIS